MSAPLATDGKPPIVLVTGATRGLGRAVALRLARLGAHLILLARNADLLASLDDDVRRLGCASTLLVPYDLQQLDGIDSLTDALGKKFDRLDGLIGNAAVLGPICPVTHAAPSAVQEVMNVNFLANWRLLRACEPLLLQAPKGRVIFITASQTIHFPSYWSSYVASKVALEAMVRCYARETYASTIKAVIMDPGAMRTDLRAQAFPGENPSMLPSPDSVAQRLADYVTARLEMPDTAIFRFA